MLTQNINAFLHTSYTIEQVRLMDAVQLNLLESYLAVAADPSLPDAMWEPEH